MAFALDFKAVKLFGVACILVSTGCSTPRLDNYPPTKVGAAWTVATRDTGSFGSGSSQLSGKFVPNRIWQGKEVYAFEGSGLTTLMTKENTKFIVVLKGDTPVTTWDPPLGWQWPIEVGKSWTSRTKQTNHAAKTAIDLEYTQTVEAYETITIPAGTYQTFRIRTSNSLGDENVQWWSPDTGIFMKQSLRRSAKHPAGAGTRELEVTSFK